MKPLKAIKSQEDKNGIILKPLPTPKDDCGSLKTAFRGKTAKQLLDQARKEENPKT
jgi:hypothetical protein